MRMRPFRTVITAILLIAALLVTGMASAEKTIVVTFTGDVTLGGLDSDRKMPDSFENVEKEKGSKYFFANFKELFENDDLTVINLEGPLTDITADKSSKKFVFRGKSDYARMLPENGIDAASLSNNHISDYGKQGERRTKEALDLNGIKWFQDYQYYVYEKDGIRIAFFALQNSVLYTHRVEFLNKIQEARDKDNVNAVVVCWHTGTEYRRFHDATTERAASNLIRDAGVDLIIINHPHVAQGMGVFQNRSVFYSLGNFVFGGNRNIRTDKLPKDPLVISLYALVVQAKLVFSDAGKYLGQQMTVYPIFSSSAKPDYQPAGELTQKVLDISNNYRPMRLTLKQAEAVYQCFKEDTSFEIPEMTEKNGLAQIDLPYVPAFDGVMLPEDDDSTGPVGMPEASSPKPTRESKDNAGN